MNLFSYLHKIFFKNNDVKHCVDIGRNDIQGCDNYISYHELKQQICKALNINVKNIIINRNCVEFLNDEDIRINELTIEKIIYNITTQQNNINITHQQFIYYNSKYNIFSEFCFYTVQVLF